MKVVCEKYLSRGYPDSPDDGTWDNEGGFIGRRQPTAYYMETPPLAWPGGFGTRYIEKMAIMDPETYAELLLLTEKKQ